jgi:hypothetical protein
VLALPALVAPAAGVVVDRVRRRPLMMATDLVIGAAVLLPPYTGISSRVDALNEGY